MNKFPLPGAFWAALLVAMVPAVSAVLTQYFPEAQYWWSPVIVASLATLAKGVQVAATRPAKIIDTSVNVDGTALPSVAAMPVDGDDYARRATTVAQRPGWQQVLLG